MFIVSKAYRGQGPGKQLFELAKTEAHMPGANRMYISATPSEKTINFYRRWGCAVIHEVRLLGLRPERAQDLVGGLGLLHGDGSYR